jgi:antibiotic biosynthesis monooxygenase (ABM) superfamily enzyme
MPEIVSVIVDRKVSPGNKQIFEKLLDGVVDACSKFPGYIETRVIKPKTTEDHRYQVFFRFDSRENLDKWTVSKERLHWVDQIDQVIEKPSHLQVITGLETWFCLPGRTTLTPPPRYKMAIVTWVAITPLLIAFNFLFSSLLAQLPFILRFVCSTPFIVLIMTYVWMPFVTRLFRFWLYPNE